MTIYRQSSRGSTLGYSWNTLLWRIEICAQKSKKFMTVLLMLVFFLLAISSAMIFAQKDNDGDGIIDSIEPNNSSDESVTDFFPLKLIYEDAEDNTTTGWEIYDNDPTGARIINVYDEDHMSHVIEFIGAGAANGYLLKK